MAGLAKIVVRFANGKIFKGYSQDFSPLAAHFHVRKDSIAGPEGSQQIFIRDLKAIFFVRHFAGDNSYEERKAFVAGKALSGRKIEVTFKDGEVLVGTTTGYDANRPGFFLFPADEKSNNERIFVVTAAIKTVRFL